MIEAPNTTITFFTLISVLILVSYAHFLGNNDSGTFFQSVLAVLKGVYRFFKGEPQEPTPYSTTGFTESATQILKTFSLLKQEELYRAGCLKPGHFIVEFIGTQDNLPFALEAFKRCIQTALQQQGYSPMLYGESEWISPNTWNIHIYFSSTPKGKAELSKLIQQKQEIQRKAVSESADAPVDEELERENWKNQKKADPEKIMLGFSLTMWIQGIKVPLFVGSNLLHCCIVGGSGSGKSTWLLYFIYQIRKSIPCEFVICDFKRSGEFTGITNHYAEYESCIDEIRLFYEEFLETPDGGNDITRILIIDEIAGLLNHLSMTKEGKKEADEIRMIMSSILMLGRSRKRFLILSMQRYSASVFPASSGSADNFMISVGLGKLSVDGRRGLFAGEHFEGEEDITFGMGKGLLLRDGYELCGLQVPRLDKQKLLFILQSMNR